MKKLLLSLTFLLSATMVSAQERPAPQRMAIDPQVAATDKNAPVITFKTTTVDYGTIAYQSNGERVFTFTNTGKSPLVVKNVNSSCGCLTPTWSKEPIRPGKSGEIKAHYDTNRIGNFNKTLTVFSNASNHTVVLQIKGTVIPDTRDSSSR